MGCCFSSSQDEGSNQEHQPLLSRTNQSVDSLEPISGPGEPHRPTKNSSLVIDMESSLIDIYSTKMLDKLAVEAIEKREEEYSLKMARVNDSSRSSTAFARESEKVWKQVFDGINERESILKERNENGKRDLEEDLDDDGFDGKFKVEF